MRRGLTPGIAALLATLLVSLLASCGLPRDMEGTTSAARERGYIRAGAVAGTVEQDEQGMPTGSDVDAVEAFATSLGLAVEWRVGAGHELIARLEHFDLDVVVGRLTPSSPYAGLVALTAPLTGDSDHIAATPPGENDWLLRWNRFLAEHG